jgi:hypothetical protein
MSSTALAVEQKLETSITVLQRRAQEIQVIDPQSYTEACAIALDGRAQIKGIGFELDPGIAAAKGTLDLLRQQKQKWVDRVTPSVELAAQKAETWKRAEREAAERENHRKQGELAAAARIKAEEEKRVADAVAKLAREAREKELEAQRKAGEIGKRELARLAKQAEEDEAKARELAAKQCEETAAAVPIVRVEAAVPKVAGIKARVNWKFRIVAAHKIPREYLMPDEVRIGQTVRSLKQAGEVIPGVEAYSEDGI